MKILLVVLAVVTICCATVLTYPIGANAYCGGTVAAQREAYRTGKC